MPTDRDRGKKKPGRLMATLYWGTGMKKGGDLADTPISFVSTVSIWYELLFLGEIATVPLQQCPEANAI